MTSHATPTIDLNCDMGERPGDNGIAADIRLMHWVTSVNIACGAHAGNEPTARAVATAAAARGLSIGAHPGYPDPANFGRASLDITPATLEASLTDQLRLFAGIASDLAVPITHIKPHGALYHDVLHQDAIASAFTRAVRSIWNPGRCPVLVGFAGTHRLAQWRSAGFAVAAEAFAERRYAADGSLLPRSQPNALIETPQDAANQAVDIALHCCVSAGGHLIPIVADTGDFIIVLNADKLRVTGNKANDKVYYRHSGHPGGIYGTKFKDMQAKHPGRALEKAVKGMLPKGPLGYAMIKKLKVYAGGEHPHAAQQPKVLEIAALET